MFREILVTFLKKVFVTLFLEYFFPRIHNLETDLNYLIEPINAEKILCVVLILRTI